MEWVSLLGVFLSLFVFIWFAYKGFNVIMLSVVCSVIVCAFGAMNPITGLRTTFMPSFAAFASNWFLVYLFSAVFAQMMGDSGAAKSIAVRLAAICRYRPKSQRYLAVLSIPLINSILTYGGVSPLVIVFIMVGIARDLFGDLDILWHFYGVASLGSATFTLGLLPGSPDVINLVPTTYLGTTPTAAPVLGIIGAVIQIVLSCVYIKIAMQKAERDGEGFLPTGARIAADATPPQTGRQTYGILRSIAPCIVLLVVMNILKQPPVLALICANLAAIVLFRKNLKLKAAVAKGVPIGVNTCALICTTVAFGSVVAASPAYSLVIGGLDRLDFLPPAFQIFVCVNIVAALTSSGTSAVTITMDQFATRFLALDVAPQAIHRLSSATSLGLNTLPHSVGVVNAAGAAKLTHREIYKHYGWITVVFPVVASFVLTVLISLGFVY